MRMSGGRGADAWMILIPVLALAVAGTMSNGGLEGVVLMLEHVIRNTVTAGLEFVQGLF
jgi:hypothetical protein